MKFKFKKVIAIVITAVLLCSSLAAFSSAATVGDTGRLNIFNYNIQGVPIPAAYTDNDRDAMVDTMEIAEKINARSKDYDIVNVQEDFNFDMYFRANLPNLADIYEVDENGEPVRDYNGNLHVLERRQTIHSGGIPTGDGLNTFSRFNLYDVYRVAWNDTFDTYVDGGADIEGDSMFPKGFSVCTIEPVEGYFVDIYNVHADTGYDESYRVRQKQFIQLSDFILKHSVYDPKTNTYDHAVVVAGDFNAYIYETDNRIESKLLQNLIERAHLNDAWAVENIDNITTNFGGKQNYSYDAYYDYAHHTDLDDPDGSLGYGIYDSVERILFASGNGLKLDLANEVADNGAHIKSFKFEKWLASLDRHPLSDHANATANLKYTIIDKVNDLEVEHETTKEVEGPFGFLFKFLDAIAKFFKMIASWFQLPSAK